MQYQGVLTSAFVQRRAGRQRTHCHGNALQQYGHCKHHRGSSAALGMTRAGYREHDPEFRFSLCENLCRPSGAGRIFPFLPTACAVG
jgi:hypothetical protein